MTDSLTALQNQTSENIRAREKELQDRRGNQPPSATKWVRPSRDDIPVPMPDGRVIGPEGLEVNANDVYIARRIRDGSLVDGQGPTPEAHPEPAAPATELIRDDNTRQAEFPERNEDRMVE